MLSELLKYLLLQLNPVKIDKLYVYLITMKTFLLHNLNYYEYQFI